MRLPIQQIDACAGKVLDGNPAAIPPHSGEPVVSESLRARLVGTNISPVTLLATDYLNHFNEIIMMLELVVDQPEMLEEARAWKPLGYAEHFRFSQFVERDLAIEVYDLIPGTVRGRLEDLVAQTHARVAAAIAELSDCAAGGDSARLRQICDNAAGDLHRFIDQISVVIHGGEAALGQPDIDGMFPAVEAATSALGQDDIDDLFK